jgi:Holliday junction resolvase RusA-like endonuclease
MSFRLELPLPPSLNSCYRNVPVKGRVKTGALRNWRNDAQGHFLLAKKSIEPVTSSYKLTVHIPQAMRGDGDNRLKPIADLLVDLKLTPDDRHCQEFHIIRSPNIREHFCLIEVEAA